jgi:hypothetical protein
MNEVKLEFGMPLGKPKGKLNRSRVEIGTARASAQGMHANRDENCKVNRHKNAQPL